MDRSPRNSDRGCSSKWIRSDPRRQESWAVAEGDQLAPQNENNQVIMHCTAAVGRRQSTGDVSAGRPPAVSLITHHMMRLAKLAACIALRLWILSCACFWNGIMEIRTNHWLLLDFAFVLAIDGQGVSRKAGYLSSRSQKRFHSGKKARDLVQGCGRAEERRRPSWYLFPTRRLNTPSFGSYHLDEIYFQILCSTCLDVMKLERHFIWNYRGRFCYIK